LINLEFSIKYSNKPFRYFYKEQPVQRPILQSVKLIDSETSKLVEVILTCGTDKFVGTAPQQLPENDLYAVACATLQSLVQFIDPSIELAIGKAAPIQHENIATELVVVTVDYRTPEESGVLTGTCLNHQHDLPLTAARATLDAINRLLST
jgi:hypothetical protein